MFKGEKRSIFILQLWKKNSFIYLFSSSSGLDCWHVMRGGGIMKFLKYFFGDTFFYFDGLTEQFQDKSKTDLQLCFTRTVKPVCTTTPLGTQI